MQSGSSETARITLDTPWALCRLPPDAATTPQDLLRLDPQWLPASCPGTVAAALLSAGYAANLADLDLDAHDWWYRTQFARPCATGNDAIVLCCQGLATLAEIWLNGQLIGRSANMYLSHRFATGDALSADNEILIRFRSLNAYLAARRPRPRWRAPMVANQQIRFVRTSLLGRTPGWSPPYPAVGPWQPIAFETAAASVLHDIQLRTALREGRGIVEFSAVVAATDGKALPDGILHLDGPEGRLSTALTRTGSTLTATLVVDEPALWWPHTHGIPALYQPSLSLQRAHAATVTLALDAVGFRTIDIDTAADGFRVRVNGIPIFCRGACWTPLNVATLSATPASYEFALQQAAAAGMNMIRVGGTMVYEADAFYAVASRLGILVWQDFMFANLDYPSADAEFLASVLEEAGQFLKRTSGQPCVAVLCGNSEAEQQAAMWGAPRDAWQPELFHVTLPALCAQHAPGTPYWPSSAHGGAFPHQASAGSCSYYGVGAYLRPLEDARRSELRFATECLALANVPEPGDLGSVPGGAAVRVHSAAWKSRSPRDLGAGWDFDDVRDHYLRLLFGVDPAALRTVDHDRYLALSRAVSAEVMEKTYAEWRRAGSLCGGALVWFLRDLWPGAGWGVVSAEGRPKAAWYGLRRALQPTAVFLTDEGVNGLDVHLVHEAATPFDGRIELRLYARGEVPLRGADIPVAVEARSTTRVAVAAHLTEFVDVTYSYRFGAPPADVIVATLLDAHGTRVSEAFHLPAGPLIERQDVGLIAAGESRPDGILELRVRCTRFSRSVSIEVDGATPEDNYFHLAPGAERRILLRRDRNTPRLTGSVSSLNCLQETGIAWNATSL